MAKLFALLRACKSFLLVGTVEPGKGNMQVLDTLEPLWQSRLNPNFVIVGSHG